MSRGEWQTERFETCRKTVGVGVGDSRKGTGGTGRERTGGRGKVSNGIVNVRSRVRFSNF